MLCRCDWHPSCHCRGECLGTAHRPHINGTVYYHCHSIEYFNIAKESGKCILLLGIAASAHCLCLARTAVKAEVKLEPFLNQLEIPRIPPCVSKRNRCVA